MATLAERLLREHCPHSSSQLVIGSVPACELADRFGTPLYVHDAGILRRRLAAVRDALGPRVKVLYALKANPSAAVAQVLRVAGSGAEVASGGEARIALAAGFDGGDVQFAGPGKTAEEIRFAAEAGLGNLNVESPAEYAAIADVARATGRRMRIAIRVNPEEAVSGSRMRMGGGAKRFGVDASEIALLVRRVIDEDAVELRGLHVYAGTQCFDSEAWLKNAENLRTFANRIEEETGVHLRSLNFGGGFGVPCFEQDGLFDLDGAGEGVRALIEEDGRSDREYFVELGRYLVAPAGFYLTRVTYLKHSHGTDFAVLDGGLHHHSAAAGVGSIVRRPFPIVKADAVAPSGSCNSYTLGGPLCTPADEIASGIQLPELHEGDLIAVLASGAYGLTFSNVMFLSHPMPAEVLVDGAEAFVARDRGREEDALRGQHLRRVETE